ncbi:MAG: hypothetical protein U9P71_06445 [Campylobacterota bacterium]|nr:hypothetical protein [Campylobacterota bacterium]
MKKWLKTNQIIVSRSLGAFLLVVGLGAFFWVNSSGSGVNVTEQRAAERVARMEARTSGTSTATSKQQSKADYTEVYTDRSKEQMKFMLIIMMFLGLGSLGYSFIKKEP